MIKPTIADTGVIVALLHEKDEWHEWTKKEAGNLPPPFLTCEAVITEASHLLYGKAQAQENLLAFLKEGFIEIPFSLSAEAARIQMLMKKYADVPMDLADACLVRMSETIKNAEVFTLDGDFLIYRKNGRQSIPLIIPNERRKM